MTSSSIRWVGLPALIALGVGTALGGVVNEARGQCVERWQPFDSATAGFGGPISSFERATIWDPDGPGPAREMFVFCGSFNAAGTVLSPRVVGFDPVLKRWVKMGVNTNNSVIAVESSSSGRLFALESSRVWEWSGTNWVSRGAPSSAPLSVMEVSPSGQLYVSGGNSTGIGHVSTLNGTSWTSVGMVEMTVFSLRALESGGLVAGGWVGSMRPTGYVKLWDGTTWTQIGSDGGLDGVDGRLRLLEELPNGEIILGGRFSRMNGIYCGNAARWDGATWHPMTIGTLVGRSPSDFAVTPSGEILTAFSQSPSTTPSPLQRWDGSAWVPDGEGLVGTPQSIIPIGEEKILAAGNIVEASGRRVAGVAIRTGSEWMPMIESVIDRFPDEVRVIQRLRDNSLIVAGGSTTQAGTLALWRYAGGSWSVMGENPTRLVNAILQLPNGDVLAGGSGGVFRWDGASWSQYGAPIPGDVNALALLADGRVAIGGSFTYTNSTVMRMRNIAVLQGLDWQPFGESLDGAVNSLVVLPNGDLVAGGAFGSSGTISVPHLAKWDGTRWSGLAGGSVNGEVRSMRLETNGDLIVAGRFAIVGGLYSVSTARWSNGAWMAMPGLLEGATVKAITARDNGELIACGDFSFTPPVASRWLARWNGTAWVPMGVTDVKVNTATVLMNVVAPDGDGGLLVGGNFYAINGVMTPRIGRLSAKPFVRDEPMAVRVQAGETVELRARLGSGFAGVSVLWTRDGVGLIDGSEGASIGGGVVTGASGAMASPTNESDAVLLIANAQAGDSGEYRAVFRSACGDVSSRVANVFVEPVETACASCAADYDRDGGVDAVDIAAFFADFEVGGICADVNDDGGVDGGDIGAFFEVHQAGGC